MAWTVTRDGIVIRTLGSYEAARYSVDRPYQPGRIELRDDKTGETWDRISGVWTKRDVAPPVPIAEEQPEHWWQR